jgi:hypothetical protein
VTLSHPCEEEHGTKCPEHGPETMGDCLNALETKSEACSSWLKVHAECSEELTKHCSKSCAGEPCSYANDAVLCLTDCKRTISARSGDEFAGDERFFCFAEELSF